MSFQWSCLILTATLLSFNSGHGHYMMPGLDVSDAQNTSEVMSPYDQLRKHLQDVLSQIKDNTMLKSTKSNSHLAAATQTSFRGSVIENLQNILTKMRPINFKERFVNYIKMLRSSQRPQQRSNITTASVVNVGGPKENGRSNHVSFNQTISAMAIPSHKKHNSNIDRDRHNQNRSKNHSSSIDKYRHRHSKDNNHNNSVRHRDRTNSGNMDRHSNKNRNSSNPRKMRTSSKVGAKKSLQNAVQVAVKSTTHHTNKPPNRNTKYYVNPFKSQLNGKKPLLINSHESNTKKDRFGSHTNRAGKTRKSYRNNIDSMNDFLAPNDISNFEFNN